MKVFVWKNGRPEAQSGYNDDLVMSFGIGMYLRDTSLKYQQQGIDMARATLNNMSTTRGGYTTAGAQNPFQINDGRGNFESINWLL
jgi:hypothetical protein